MARRTRSRSSLALAFAVSFLALNGISNILLRFIWVIVLGHGSDRYPHGSHFFWACTALGVLGVWLLLAVARSLWRDGTRFRRLAVTLLVLGLVLNLLPPYTLWGIIWAAVVLSLLIAWLVLSRQERSPSGPALRST